MKKRNLLALAACVALPTALHAQPVTGLYVGAGIGINQLLDANLKGGAPASEMRSDIGFATLGSVGVGLGGGMRIELEGNYRQQQSHNRPGGASGTSYSFGPMVNLLYDFDLHSGVTPYVGAGVGAQWMRIPGRGSSEAKLAAQGILGAAFPLATPGLSMTVEARAISTVGDEKFHTGSLGRPINVSGLIGLRYAFGAAPAPAPVAAATQAPAPMVAGKAEEARTYLVFFDWDRSDLTDRARQIIADAAGASSRLAVTRIEVAGHADTSGTAQYNQGLSMRRGQIVASELVRLGVKKEAITVSAYGDTRPLVQAAPGAREPQNRRVEIVLK